MGDGDHATTGAGPDVFSALVAALRRAIATVGELAGADPEQAYHRSTELLAELADASDALAVHRAVSAYQVAADRKLSVAKLAAHLSTPRFPIGKSRAGQLLVVARSHI